MEQQPNKNKDRLKEITDSIERGIQEVFESDKYQQYLRTMSRFHNYSLNNTMLIAMQRPDATLVAGFGKWDKAFGRHVLRGERGIKIIAPTPYKVKKEREKLDPDTRAPMRDADGKIITEEVEVKIPLYKVVSVFDVSQTDGKPLPTLAADLAGDVKQFDVFMEALRRSAPVPIRFERLQENLDGYFRQPTDGNPDGEKFIAVREGMSEVQTICAAIHEIGHAKLHDREQARLMAQADPNHPPKPKDKSTREVEAESVSYAVCQYYGIETGENSFGYIATWSKDRTLPELRESLDTINRTADGLINDIDQHFAGICKERGIDLAAQEQEPPEAETPAPEQPVEIEAAQEAIPAQSMDAEEIAEVLSDTEGLFDGERITSVTIEKYDPDAPTPELPQDYPMPDPTLTMQDMESYGYTDGDMLPLSRERAVALFEQDVSVYMLLGGNGAGMVFDREDIDAHAGMFAVSREEWDDCRDSVLANEIALAAAEPMESRFLTAAQDSFAIYQVKEGKQYRDLRFERFDLLQKNGIAVTPDHYDLVYTDRLDYPGNTIEKLQYLFDMFNLEHPEDYRGHSASVSDIIALKVNGQVSYHYVDAWGFVELPHFHEQENPLKNAEMAVEDDYGMIDGIINNGQKPTVAELEAQVKAGQTISLLDLANAVKSESAEKRKSVMEQLKQAPKPQEHKRTARESAEMER